MTNKELGYRFIIKFNKEVAYYLTALKRKGITPGTITWLSNAQVDPQNRESHLNTIINPQNEQSFKAACERLNILIDKINEFMAGTKTKKRFVTIVHSYPEFQHIFNNVLNAIQYQFNCRCNEKVLNLKHSQVKKYFRERLALTKKCDPRVKRKFPNIEK